MKQKSDRIYRIVRNRKCVHSDVADGKLRSGAEDSPVSMFLERAVTSDRFSGQGVGVYRYLKFPTKHFQATNVIAMLVGKQDAIELFRSDSALFEAQCQLPRAQSAINQNVAVTSGDEGAVSRTSAPQHRQTEHVAMCN